MKHGCLLIFLIIITGHKISPSTKCQQEPGLTGDCSEDQPRWTNVERFGCYAFQYSGCGGNANNFMTKNECLQSCNSNLSIGSQSEMGSIANGGQAILNIDKKGKRHCKYEHDKFIVTKTQEDDGEWTFTADRGSGSALCSVGNIMNVDVAQKAQRCGLGTFLMMLCLVDSDMNGKNGNVNGPLAADNEALKDLKIFYVPGHIKQHNWVKANCQSIWTLHYLAEIGAAKGYFDAALDTGFTQMLMAESVLAKGEDFKIEGPERTQHWKNNYDEKTGLILQSIDVYSAHWFFCKPVRGQ